MSAPCAKQYKKKHPHNTFRPLDHYANEPNNRVQCLHYTAVHCMHRIQKKSNACAGYKAQPSQRLVKYYAYAMSNMRTSHAFGA